MVCKNYIAYILWVNEYSKDTSMNAILFLSHLLKRTLYFLIFELYKSSSSVECIKPVLNLGENILVSKGEKKFNSFFLFMKGFLAVYCPQ